VSALVTNKFHNQRNKPRLQLQFHQLVFVLDSFQFVLQLVHRLLVGLHMQIQANSVTSVQLQVKLILKTLDN